MKLIGLDDRGRTVFDAALEHGADPERVAFEADFQVLRPLCATRDADSELVLRLEVAPVGDAEPPPLPARGQDRSLVLEPGVVPERRQRCAAYAVVLSEWGLLATEYSELTAVAGRWGMPGGGIDDDEEPAGTVAREVTEETDQVITLGELIRVQTSHWVGLSPRGTLEDFHAVRLIYRGHCANPTDPVVLDRGGTTESARWIPVDRWDTLDWTQNWQTVLTELLG